MDIEESKYLDLHVTLTDCMTCLAGRVVLQFQGEIGGSLRGLAHRGSGDGSGFLRPPFKFQNVF